MGLVVSSELKPWHLGFRCQHNDSAFAVNVRSDSAFFPRCPRRAFCVRCAGGVGPSGAKGGGQCKPVCRLAMAPKTGRPTLGRPPCIQCHAVGTPHLPR